MEKNFIRVRSTKDITISLTLTIAGGVLVALPTATSVNILGFFMIFAGIILFLMLRTGYKEEEDKGNAVRLDIYHSKQSGKAYIQLFEYVPYKYEPCTRQFEYEISETGKLI